MELARMSDLLRPRLVNRIIRGGRKMFPALKKWQCDEFHGKDDWEVEKHHLLQQDRMRFQLHLKLAGATKPYSPDSTTSCVLKSSDCHVNGLTSHVMKGVADFSIEDDEPLQETEARLCMMNKRSQGPISSPMDLRKLMTKVQGNSTSTCNFSRRDYSTLRSSGFQSLSNLGNTSSHRQLKYKRNESSSSDDDEYRESGTKVGVSVGEKRRAKEICSLAALANYDVKVRKRVPLKKIVVEELDFPKDVDSIRHEIRQNKLVDEAEMSYRCKEESFLSEKRFDECGISPLTVKAMTEAGYVQMTRVQETTLSVCRDGKDAMIKAKTGTGKTAAYLLPAIEAILKAASTSVDQRVHQIHVLILCPTRELASQITAEANALLRFHDGIGVQSLVGGTRFKDDQRHLEFDPCQIIVATPGRLLDHIENRGGLSVHLMGLKMLILDEADHLLDLGFRKDVEKIVDCLPRQRQSLLFSATIPKEVRRISQLVLNRDHAFVDTIGLGSAETPVKVRQSFLVVSHELHFQVVHHLLKEHILATPDYKVIVFCTTGMVTSLMYQILREMKMNVREIHSRKPQLYRTRVSDEFKESKQLILVTSDVSSRGMNYPDVTLVIQMGIPSNREQYIHRLGRTGREDKGGEGMLLLAPWEEYFIDELKELPLEKVPSPDIDPEVKLKMESSIAKVDNSIKEGAYHAWLGYYNSIREIGRDKTTLVELANKFCESIGLSKPPSIFRKTALKMGLKHIPGIRIRQ
ncbi:Probable DEAD-box ATP-dependent RNA helicase 48 [Linum perenne]